MWWKVATSWLAVLAGTAFAIRFYSPDLFNKLTGHIFARAQPSPVVAEPPAKRQKAKRTLANRLESSNSGVSTPTLSATEGKVNKKRKLISPPVENQVVARTNEGRQVTLLRDEDDDMSNKEFAQQLARAQAGTKLEPANTQGQTKKERRAAGTPVQGKPNGPVASGRSTDTSSATGRDGDDDVSPIGSPSTGAVSTAPTSRAGDVSDMLEAPAAKPGVLRLTDVKDSGSKPPAKSSQSFQPALTKKQRQRQAKAAEQKSIREESDRLHEQKKQAQLRAARLAEGSSNQTKADAFTSKQNAWQSSKPAAEKLAQTSRDEEVGPLLDTFEKPVGPTFTVHGAVTAEPLSDITNAVPGTANVNTVRKEIGVDKTNALAPSDREKVHRPTLGSQSSWADEVNEEEQDNWATELAQEEKWESVTTKKGKKKGKKENGDTSSEASFSITKPLTNGRSAVNGHQASDVKTPQAETSNRFQSIEAITDPAFTDAEWEA
ncbi:hypothetical protein A1O7_06100 [Cladophialophora yegresii CBS 114405]|uniref:Uncharacterized protein n=1 Tax=Cladophialophora yegresii CBS 114405 TaxID=1182544 RepID=W9VSE8_9EURO|nr:uncharacterized protein A1O7_06100 [Cladophialophora yegresii CBS 114405]EXJ58672.1 hypothetical protein A1O7_06100 [Cladophialophora yegresii CBS 114405]